LENEKEIVSLNQEQLYDKGVRANNTPVGSEYPYTQFTKAIKARKGQRIDHVTLKDTGDFYKSFELIVTDKSFEIIAKDSKTEKLKDKYKPEILGLTEESIAIVRGMLKAYLLKEAR
jgi:hypothetical protein